MIEAVNTEYFNLQKIPGIFQDKGLENQEIANRLLQFFIESDVEGAPKKSFVFAILRDSVVSRYLRGEGTLEEIILSKVSLEDHPEQLADFVTLSSRDLQETLRNTPRQ